MCTATDSLGAVKIFKNHKQAVLVGLKEYRQCSNW